MSLYRLTVFSRLTNWFLNRDLSSSSSSRSYKNKTYLSVSARVKIFVGISRMSIRQKCYKAPYAKTNDNNIIIRQKITKRGYQQVYNFKRFLETRLTAPRKFHEGN